jgi:hypothetical protein
VLSQARWSSRAVAQKLLAMILAAFLPSGPAVIGMDDTIERRWGPKIAARGIYRDPVRSTHGHFVKASGLRWLSLMVTVPIPFIRRRWALPFFTILAPSQRWSTELLTNRTTRWTKIVMPEWYGGEERRTLQIVTGTSIWYHAGLPPVPIRWLLVRDPSGVRDPQAFLCTDLDATPAQILGWFVQRWSIETIFQEVRDHLGVETQGRTPVLGGSVWSLQSLSARGLLVAILACGIRVDA